MSKEAMKQWLTVLKTCRENLFLKDYVEHIDQAITSLRQAIAEAEKQEQGEPVAWERFTNFANPLGTRLIFTTKFEADEWLKDFVEGHAWLKPLSYTTPQPKQEQSVNVSNPIGEFPKTVLAVIKEVANRNPKNGLDRWTDSETGAYMQDDADAALLWIKNKAKQEHGEPVAWMDKNKFEHLKKNNAVLTTVTSWSAFDDDVPLYTTPQPKQEQSVSVSTECVGEPVGEMQLSAIYEGMVVPVVSVELPVGTKLYTTPYVPTGRQQRKPLTDNEICNMVARISDVRNPYIQFARAIEAAHGIKGKHE